MKRVLIFLITAVTVFVTGCAQRTGQEMPAKSSKIVFAVYRDGTDTMRRVVEGFTNKNPGIDIKIMELSDEGAENHRILGSVLAGNEVAVDVFAAEDIWMREFEEAGYLQPLDSYVKPDFSEYPKRISDTIYNEGKLYAIPLELDAGIMYYRRDLTDGELNYSTFLTNGAKYSIQGADKEEMICVVRECVNLTGGIQSGLELYKSLVAGSEYASNNYLSDFKSGKTAYARSWVSNSAMLQFGFNNIRGKVKTRLLTSDGGAYAAARVYCVAVNSASDKSKAVFIRKFLSYLLEENTQLQIAKGRGTLPLRYKYYKSAVVCDYNDYNEDFAEWLDRLNFRPLMKNYMELSEKAQESIQRYIKGEATVAEAAETFGKIYGQ